MLLHGTICFLGCFICFSEFPPLLAPAQQRTCLTCGHETTWNPQQLVSAVPAAEATPRRRKFDDPLDPVENEPIDPENPAEKKRAVPFLAQNKPPQLIAPTTPQLKAPVEDCLESPAPTIFARNESSTTPIIMDCCESPAPTSSTAIHAEPLMYTQGTFKPRSSLRSSFWKHRAQKPWYRRCALADGGSRPTVESSDDSPEVKPHEQDDEIITRF